jgi:hypothetical protein
MIHPSWTRSWPARQIIVKLSPGVELSQLVAYGGGVEFVSVNGELKEAVLWLDGASTGTMATLIVHEGAACYTSTGEMVDFDVYHWSWQPLLQERPLSEPRGWLVEPDPALIRAGLVQDVAELMVINWMELSPTSPLTMSQCRQRRGRGS